MLFDISSDNIGLHIKNICTKSRLNEISTTEDFSVVRLKSGCEVCRTVKHSESELRSFGHIVNGYLDFAEEYAKRQIPITMEDWAKYLDLILQANGKDLPQDAGEITAVVEKHTESKFEKYCPIKDWLFESDFDKAMKILENKNN